MFIYMVQILEGLTDIEIEGVKKFMETDFKKEEYKLGGSDGSDCICHCDDCHCECYGCVSCDSCYH